MKKFLSKFKDNLITGAIVLIPLVAVGVIFAGVIKKMIELTTPFTEKMNLGGPVSRAIVAAIIIVTALAILFLIIGIIVKTYFGKNFKNWLETKVYVHIPFYKTFVNVAYQITGKEKENYPVVEVDLYGNNNKVLGLITDTLSDGRYVIYTPFSPVINFGQVHIVVKENVKILDVSVKDATEIITKIGFEASKFYK